MILFPINGNQTYTALPASNDKRSFKHGYKCSVLSCNSYSGTNLEYAFFSFPKIKNTSSELLDAWIEACNNPALLNRDPNYLHRCRRICSKHFLENLIQKGKLVPGAIPMLCLGKEDIRRDHCYAQFNDGNTNIANEEIHFPSEDLLQEHSIGDSNIGNTTSFVGCSKSTQTETITCKPTTWSTQTQTCKRMVGRTARELKLQRRIKRLLSEIKCLEKELVDEKTKNGPPKQETLTIQFV